MTIDPTEVMESVKLMQKLENEFKDAGDSTDNGSVSEEDVPQTQPSKPLQKGQEHDTPSTKEQETAGDQSTRATKASEHTPGKSARQVDIINVPNLLRREKARTQLKQLKLTRGADQLAVPNYPSHLTMSLKQLLEWATKASNLKEVLEMLEKYPVQLKDLYLWARMPECHWEVVRTSHYMHTFVILADLAGPCGL
ncbi:hypothetical protein PC110_g21183 [Phytophthora cactorum]|uniref:Uncharacterized protein n=2 Tax=Phytophthora cactorum TaxID=29920 RepID=A0A329RF14_9STRA|nr:hypothetical protein PC110_g21183 [Phytophthora cactorum]